MTITRPKFRAHVKAHRTVIAHERWFRKGPPFLGKPFTVKKTVQRHAAVIKILSRAGKRAARAGDDELADAYRRLQAKLTHCGRWRSGAICGAQSNPAQHDPTSCRRCGRREAKGRGRSRRGHQVQRPPRPGFHDPPGEARCGCPAQEPQAQNGAGPFRKLAVLIGAWRS
jgi:hypothetical protein